MALWAREGRDGLFAMADPVGGRHEVDPIQTTYAVIDLETTGLAARNSRIVEVAVVRVRADGSVESEFSSLVDPGCDVGPTWVHHVTNDAVAGAPLFGDIAGEVLARLEGAVVVAHNAVFEEAFLAAELARCGLRVPPLPALCTLALSHWVDLPVPNHRLATCCDHFGIELTDAHTALGDTRATAKLLVQGLHEARTRGLDKLAFPEPFSRLPAYPLAKLPRHRVSKLRKGEQGWMANMVSKLPVVTHAADPAATDAYLDLLAEAVSDGKIVGHEAKALARLAGDAGMGATHLIDLHRRFLDGMRDVAAADDHISRAEHRDLTKVAGLLGEPGYFDDLVCDEPESPAVPRSRPTPTAGGPGGPLSGVRVLFAGSSAELAEVRAAAEAAGVSCAKNVTRSLRFVVSAPGHDDRRLGRARELGIEVIGVDRAWAVLGLAPGDESGSPAAAALTVAVTGVSADGRGRASAVLDVQAEADVDGTADRCVTESGPPVSAPPPLPPAGWYPDPSLRYPIRHWDGHGWTRWVAVDGVVYEDDPASRPR